VAVAKGAVKVGDECVDVVIARDGQLKRRLHEFRKAGRRQVRNKRVKLGHQRSFFVVLRT
jgi:hypothetical protein